MMKQDLTHATTQAQEFLEPITNTPLYELGQIFADEINTWRLKNQLNNIEKVQKIIEEYTVKIKKIPNRILFEYLDGVSLEDNETLQDMWANLFVNYIDSEKNLTLTVYPEILKQLSSEEVEILSILYKIGTTYDPPYTESESSIALQAIHNLLRLGLIATNYTVMYNRDEIVKINQTKTTIKKAAMIRNYHLTDFGTDFYQACTRTEDKAN